ncbi:fatty acid synthase beta subunit fas1 [Tyrophagus putrescentiae]|nr:fatty acid synthase beta subunit fas1 [Tyrophagus putrescentiae]
MLKEWVDKDLLASSLLKGRGCTIFAPTNAAIAAFLEKNPNGLTTELLESHISTISIKRDQFPRTIPVFNNKVPAIVLNVRPFGPLPYGRPPMDNYFYVNNALVTEYREDLASAPAAGTSGPQVVYVIDEVLSIYEPVDLAPTALEFLENPGVYRAFGGIDVSAFLTHVKRHQLESVFSAAGRNTFFLPTNLEAGKAGVDRYVIKAHVIGKQSLFVRTLGEKVEHNTLASDDNVEVKLSLSNQTSRFSVDKVYFIQTNTVKNDKAHHLGKVLSRLSFANIPVRNGIIHIIDKPLMLMDLSVRDFLHQQPKLRRFTELLDKNREIISEMDRQTHKTILAPDDNAFENLVNNNENFTDINERSEEIRKILRQHIVMHSVSTTDLKKVGNTATYNTSANIPVTFRLVGNGENSKVLTVELGGVNATSLQSDFGASDGILHVIDRVLGIPFKTLLQKLRSQKELLTTFKIGSQGSRWNDKLQDENRRYTFFAPSDEAWKAFQRENPSEFHQLEEELYPAISRAILDRHITAKGQFNRKDLFEKVKKIESVQGELIISPDPITKDIYVEWEGKRAKVIKSDIYGLNGVIHIVDAVLAKKRDFKVNGTVGFGQISPLFTVLALVVSFLVAKFSH